MLEQVPTPPSRLWSLRSAWRDPPRQRSWNKRARREVRLVRALYRLTHFVCAAEREKGDKIRRLDYYHARNIGVTSGDVSLIYYYVHLIWFPVKGIIYIKFGFLYYIYRSLYDDVIGRLHSSLVSTGLDDGFPIWGSSLCCLNSPTFLFSSPVLYTYWMNFVWSMPTVGAGQ
jgi:hypothetical protein